MEWEYWDTLLAVIEEGQCVFFLGPDLLEVKNEATGGEYANLQQAILQRLSPESGKSEYLRYYEQDELFLFANPPRRNNAYINIKAMLNRSTFQGELLTKLAAIPSPLLVSFSPYLNAQKTFQELNIPYTFDYGFYHKKRNANDSLSMPSVQNPLVYGLLGNITEAESLVLTYDDLFDYIRAIMGGKELENAFRQTLSKSFFFVFLGFQFDKWYVQLIMRLLMHLKKNSENEGVTWVAVNEHDNPEIVDVCEKEFNISFVKDINKSAAFIQTLYDKCAAQNLLRVPSGEAANQSVADKIESFLLRDALDEVVALMLDSLDGKDDDLYDQASMQSNRLSRLKRRIDEGTIAEQDMQLERNKIVVALRELNKSLKAIV